MTLHSPPHAPLLAWHQRHQAPIVDVQGLPSPQLFTDPWEEYQAVRARVGLLDASALGILELTGPGRATLLHGLVTNDITSLPLDHACWACLLTPTGHVSAVLLVLHRAECHWVIAPQWLLPRVQAFLARYIIMEDVRVTDRSREWCMLGLQGPDTPRLLSAWAGASLPCVAQTWYELPSRAPAVGVLGHDPFGVPGALCVVPTARAVETWEQCLEAGARPAGLAAFQTLRVESGVAWYGVDADETMLLPETGWERTATSYTKGCYIGQEIVARVANRGHVQRHLSGVTFPIQQPPATPCELWLNDRPCGRLTSAAYSPLFNAAVGLGMISRPAWAPGARLTVSGQSDVTGELVGLLQLPLPA